MRLFVPLARDELDALLEVARAERRRPQDQAAVLLSQSLRALRGAELGAAGSTAPAESPAGATANRPAQLAPSAAA
jgi:hypothetical protein